MRLKWFGTTGETVMDLALIRGFRIAAQIIIFLSLVGAAAEIIMVSLGLSTVFGLSYYLITTSVSAFIGGVMWWYFNRRYKIVLEKMLSIVSPQPFTKTPDGKMTREEFVATLARLVGAKKIDEDAVANGIHMMQLNTIACVNFNMMFASTMQPTIGKLIDNLYRQYLCH